MYYIIVKKKIYDVTEFIDSHPGGKNCILKNLYKNCDYHMKFHSKKAIELLKKMEIKNTIPDKDNDCVIL